ncbi:TIGR01777 family oxidoreductase [Chloroflexota bacterium]
MNILITGSSGLIGSSLVRSLKISGNTILSLSREPGKDGFKWDPARGEIDLPYDVNIDVVIHLAGENIARARWSKKQKELILDSRVKGTRLLVDTIIQLQPPPKTLLSASGIGIYGDRYDVLLDEDDQTGEGFLEDVAREWEAATRVAVESGIRVANLRMGVVMSKEGGVLKRLLPLFKCGLGAILGSGNQYMSWIMIDDVVTAIEYILTNEDIKGPINMVAPNPVTNKEFTKILGIVLHRPAILRIPAWAIQAVYGEMGKELLLTSTRALPRRLISSGFDYQFPVLEDGLRHVLKKDL